MNILTSIFKQIFYLGASASILILLILLIKKIFNKALSPKWHYYIWILLFIRLIIPFYPQSSISIYNLFSPLAEEINLSSSSISSIFSGNSSVYSSLKETSSAKTDLYLSNDQNLLSSNENGMDSESSNSTTLDTSETYTENKYDLIINLVAFAWLIGIILLSLYTIYTNVIFAVKVHKKYKPFPDERINHILEKCKNIMNIYHPIPLVSSKEIISPALYSLFHSKLLVSEVYMLKLNDNEVKHIFLHELSHYKRKDIIINYIASVLKIIYFFNPLIWYALYKMQEDCEISCDAEALKYLHKSEHYNYGNTLIKLLKIFSSSKFIAITAGISKNKSSYKRRIKMISNYKKNTWIGTALAVILIFSIGLLSLTGCNKSTDTATFPDSTKDSSVSPNKTDDETINKVSDNSDSTKNPPVSSNKKDDKTNNKVSDNSNSTNNNTSSSKDNITEKTKNYILGDQGNKANSEKILWSETFLNRVDIETLYKQYLANGGTAGDLENFANYMTLNAPIQSDWKSLFEKDLYDTYGQKVSRLEYIGDDMYQAYVIIDGSEVPYVGVSSRTGYFHG